MDGVKWDRFFGEDLPLVATVVQRWQLAPPAPDNHLATFAHMPRPVAQILFNRGLGDLEKADEFLDGHYRDDNPFRIKGVNDAVTLIRRTIRSADPIAVYGDFDADGVTATALLVETLQSLGADARPYIPHRVDEGYGLRVEALDELADQGVRLVITVDCGIRALDEVAHGVARGLDVIVTDHHSVGEDPPPASAIISPKQPGCKYRFKELAGVGIAYKLAQALLRSHRQVPVVSEATGLDEEDLLDLVALGTVADLAPLLGENRTLVKRGLIKLNEGQRPGIVSLIQRSGLRLGQVDASAIGFGLGPRINAAGRMADAQPAYQLLTTHYPGEADKLADELNELNRQRQQITAETQDRARQQALSEGDKVALLFAASPDFLEGVVGLAAGRLCEEFYRPAIVAAIGPSTSRGSARSISEFHITDALDECKDLLVRHGGHAAAAGFTVSNENLPQLAQQLKHLAAQALADKALQPTLLVDAQIGLGELNRALYDWLIKLAPFGYANPAPVFMTRRLRVVDGRAVGANRSHLKLHLSDGRTRWDAIAFRQAHWLQRLPGHIDVAYHLELNRWNGHERLQLNVRDLRPTQQGEKDRQDEELIQ
jgi:single-stranded-DNA-specific exonuclease